MVPLISNLFLTSNRLRASSQVLHDSMNCAITGEVMKEPVMDPEGNSYERSAILDWLSRSQTSPITRTPLTPDQLVPNRALQQLIEEASGSALQSAVTMSREERLAAVNAVHMKAQSERAEAAAAARERIAGDPGLDSSVALTVAHEAGPLGGTDTVMVSVLPPAGTERTPLDVCMVIDTSGSMCNAATQGAEADGLSLLDIVKHGVPPSLARASHRFTTHQPPTAFPPPAFR